MLKRRGKDSLGDRDLDRWIILKWIFGAYIAESDWIKMDQDRI
jgi:hypothetical protein